MFYSKRPYHQLGESTSFLHGVTDILNDVLPGVVRNFSEAILLLKRTNIIAVVFAIYVCGLDS